MLPKTHSLKALALACLVSLTAPGALAEDAPAANKQFVPYLDTQGISPEQLREAQELGEGVVRNILDAYNRLQTAA